MTQPTAPPDVSLPENPREAASKVDLPPILAAVLSVWLMISPTFIRYPLSVAGENASLRDRGLALLMLFAAICWARARVHRRRYLVLFALLCVVLIVLAVVVNGLTGPLRGPAVNELVVGVLGLLIAAAGWRSAGHDRPAPGDTSEVANLRSP
jgi:peptidoglycan/LPS O-acetylase OafA/YrhL